LTGFTISKRNPALKHEESVLWPNGHLFWEVIFWWFLAIFDRFYHIKAKSGFKTRRKRPMAKRTRVLRSNILMIFGNFWPVLPYQTDTSFEKSNFDHFWPILSLIILLSKFHIQNCNIQKQCHFIENRLNFGQIYDSKTPEKRMIYLTSWNKILYLEMWKCDDFFIPISRVFECHFIENRLNFGQIYD
jgi:hypothetical protein